MFRSSSMTFTRSRKKAAPGIVQREPLRCSGITERIPGNMQQPMSAWACRFGAVPVQKCDRWVADANRRGERMEAHRTALLLIGDHPAQDKYEWRVPHRRQRYDQHLNEKYTKHDRLDERDLQGQKDSVAQPARPRRAMTMGRSPPYRKHAGQKQTRERQHSDACPQPAANCQGRRQC